MSAEPIEPSFKPESEDFGDVTLPACSSSLFWLSLDHATPSRVKTVPGQKKVQANAMVVSVLHLKAMQSNRRQVRLGAGSCEDLWVLSGSTFSALTYYHAQVWQAKAVDSLDVGDLRYSLSSALQDTLDTVLDRLVQACGKDANKTCHFVDARQDVTSVLNVLQNQFYV